MSVHKYATNPFDIDVSGEELLAGIGIGAALGYLINPEKPKRLKGIMMGGVGGALAAVLLKDILSRAGQQPTLIWLPIVGAAIGAVATPYVIPVKEENLMARIFGALTGAAAGNVVTHYMKSSQEHPRVSAIKDKFFDLLRTLSTNNQLSGSTIVGLAIGFVSSLLNGIVQ